MSSNPTLTAKEGIKLSYSYKNHVAKNLTILSEFKPESNILNLTFPKAQNDHSPNRSINSLKGRDTKHSYGIKGKMDRMLRLMATIVNKALPAVMPP